MTTSPTDHDTTAQDDTAAQGAGTEDASQNRDAAVASEAMLRDLAQSIGLLPQAPDSDADQPSEDALIVPVIEQDGTRYIPVFTSEDALRAAGADPATAVRLPIAQLAARWPNGGLWLAVNLASEQGIALPPDLVRVLPALAQTTPNGSASDSSDGSSGGSAPA
ncbi:MAG: hypothetical protein QOJ78_1701 [Pseudonocardiales bacterium]|nr:hypothetical protein [Pseudonocardiales bacterium]